MLSLIHGTFSTFLSHRSPGCPHDFRTQFKCHFPKKPFFSPYRWILHLAFTLPLPRHLCQLQPSFLFRTHLPCCLRAEVSLLPELPGLVHTVREPPLRTQDSKAEFSTVWNSIATRHPQQFSITKPPSFTWVPGFVPSSPGGHRNHEGRTWSYLPCSCCIPMPGP